MNGKDRRKTERRHADGDLPEKWGKKGTARHARWPSFYDEQCCTPKTLPGRKENLENDYLSKKKKGLRKDRGGNTSIAITRCFGAKNL